jgi:transcriptional regulator with XRE-family HTH domain
MPKFIDNCNVIGYYAAMSNVGDRLRHLRVGLGLTPTELARRAGVSAAYVTRLEAGEYSRPSHVYLSKLASALGVPVAEIAGEGEGANNHNHIGEGGSPYAHDISLDQAIKIVAARSPGLTLKQVEALVEGLAELDEWDANAIEAVITSMRERKRKSTDK